MNNELDWMRCTACRQTVLQNEIGICLCCQRKYERSNQPDSWENIHRCKRCGRKYPVYSEKCGICDNIASGMEQVYQNSIDDE